MPQYSQHVRAQAHTLTTAIGAVFKQHRLDSELTFSTVTRHTGVSASLLTRIESGQRPPTIHRIVQLSLAFDIDPASVLSMAQTDAFPLGWPSHAPLPKSRP